MTMFTVIKESESSIFWKATIRIACLKYDPETNQILKFKLLDLREFLKISDNFQKHFDAMQTCEQQSDRVRKCFTKEI